MTGRKSNRTKHRTPCAVTIDGRRHNGFLIDYSLSGLFIQTSAKPKVGQRLDLELTLRGEKLPMHVEVARRKTVPAQLRALAGGGIGVRILSAPEAFYRMLADQEVRAADEGARSLLTAAGSTQPRASRPRSEAPTPDLRPASPPVEAMPVFRVRVRTIQGNRTRMLQVGAHDEDEAAGRAIEELGEAWKVFEVTRVAGA